MLSVTLWFIPLLLSCYFAAGAAFGGAAFFAAAFSLPRAQLQAEIKKGEEVVKAAREARGKEKAAAKKAAPPKAAPAAK